MATICFLISEHTGHFHASLRIARGLRARGHRVVYLGYHESRSAVERQGFTFEFAGFPKAPSAMPAGRTRAEVRRAVDMEITRYLAAAWDIAHRLRPDLIVCDPFVLMYYPPYWAKGIRAVALCNYPLLDWDWQVPPYTSSIVPSAGPCSAARVVAAWARSWCGYGARTVNDRVRQIWHGPTDVSYPALVAAASGLPLARQRIHRSVWWDMRLRCVPELVLWTRDFDLPRTRQLRDGVHFIGPSVDVDRVEPTFDWSRLRNDATLVYCALGTVEFASELPKRADFLRRVILAFRDAMDLTLVIAAGRALDAEQLPALPPNVVLVREAPQLALLRRARLFITHGGANSVKESIALGVPMLVYPRRADQPGNAARVAYHGIGIRGTTSDRAADIDAKVRCLLREPGYRARVMQHRARFRDYDARLIDVRSVESFLGSRNAAPGEAPA